MSQSLFHNGSRPQVLVCGAGGFIGSHLVNRLRAEGHDVRGVDLKYPDFSPTQAHEFIIGDLRDPTFARRAVQDIDEVYQLAADTGAAGYIFTGDHDAGVMHNSASINLNVLEAGRLAHVKKFFYSSSACIYPERNQLDPDNPICSEESAYPAAPDSEYGWEKLFSELSIDLSCIRRRIQQFACRSDGPEPDWSEILLSCLAFVKSMNLSTAPPIFLMASLLFATALLPGQSAREPASTRSDAATALSGSSVSLRGSDYVLGPGDQISIAVTNLETNFAGRTFRIDMSGEVTLPFIGRIKAAGLSTAGLEAAMRPRLEPFLKNPEVVVAVAYPGSRPVSVLGAVNNPGIRQVEQNQRLFEVLSMAGGLRTDAGYQIHITRDVQQGKIPLSTSHLDESGQFSIASVRVTSIMNSSNPDDNIIVLPGDRISVPRADVVYALGSVTKPGGFLLNEHESLSALQVISLAEGLQRTAASNKAMILRSKGTSTDRVEIPVNLKMLMAGKGEDLQLQAGDILFVPGSAAKNASYRTIEAIITAATGAAIYAR